MDSEYQNILEDFLEDYYFRFSVDATRFGIHRYDFKLSSLRKSEILEWKSELWDLRKRIQKFKNGKSRDANLEILLFERKISEELVKLDGEAEYFTDPLLYISNIFEGLIYPAFGSYASLSVRGKSFTSRLKDISNIKRAMEENLRASNSLEKKVAKDQAKILKILINEFTGYLLTKSDIEKKDDIKQAKNSALEDLAAIENILNSLPIDTSINPSFYRSILNKYPEIINDLKEKEEGIRANIEKVADLIVKKAREIKISAPFFETLKNVLDERVSISQDQFDSIFESLKNIAQELFGETGLRVNFKKTSISEENIQTIYENYYPFEIIIPGVFDRKPNVSFTLFSEMSIPILIYNLVTLVYPGKSLLIEVRKRKEKAFLKSFENKLLEEGWKLYVLQETRNQLKKLFGNGLELSFLYNEYRYLLKALIQCKLVNHEIDLGSVEQIVSEDQIILNKNLFLQELVLDDGASIAGFAGLMEILELKRQLSKKYRDKDFNINLLSHSSLPFRALKEVL
jgi:hemoglobin-like flavoprotein